MRRLELTLYGYVRLDGLQRSNTLEELVLHVNFTFAGLHEPRLYALLTHLRPMPVTIRVFCHSPLYLENGAARESWNAIWFQRELRYLALNRVGFRFIRCTFV